MALPPSPAIAAFAPFEEWLPELTTPEVKARPTPVWLPVAATLIVAGVIGYVNFWPTRQVPVEAIVVGATASVFAPGDGTLGNIFVASGMRITRGTELFEVIPPRPDPKRLSDLATRIDLAKAREIRLGMVAQEVSQILARGRPAADPSGLREAELSRQRLRDVQEQLRSIGEERTKLEQTLADQSAAPAPLSRVQADRDGFVTRILVAEGGEVVPGLKLAEFVDCSRLSLSLDAAAAAAAGLVPGTSAQLHLPNSQSVLSVRVPEQGQRNGGGDAGRILVPLEAGDWRNAGGSTCPLGVRVSMTRTAS
jgi:multidrug efflux pump subunit AcrA (membrane-fusion protein)